MRLLACLAGLVVIVGLETASAQESVPTVFKSAVERVAVTAVVRDSRGKLVTNLQPSDFELLADGRPHPMVGVWSEASPASVGILMDVSGSMATKLERARDAARTIVAGLKPGVDEVAFYTFDTTLTQVRPFSDDFANSESAWLEAKAFGATSLWDAIARTAQEISVRQRRRALIVITDGVDSASSMKPSDVSAIASELDVPVYMMVISFALEEEQRDIPTTIRGPLGDLATWTGGDSLMVRDLETLAAAARLILAELRHQYVIAFEPRTTPGWHPVLVRTRKSGYFVRSRSGYMVK